MGLRMEGSSTFCKAFTTLFSRARSIEPFSYKFCHNLPRFTRSIAIKSGVVRGRAFYDIYRLANDLYITMLHQPALVSGLFYESSLLFFIADRATPQITSVPRETICSIM